MMASKQSKRYHQKKIQFVWISTWGSFLPSNIRRRKNSM